MKEVLKAQSETVNRVEDTIEWTYMNTKHAEKDLERAAEIQNGNRYAVAIVIRFCASIPPLPYPAWHGYF